MGYKKEISTSHSLNDKKEADEMIIKYMQKIDSTNNNNCIRTISSSGSNI